MVLNSNPFCLVFNQRHLHEFPYPHYILLLYYGAHLISVKIVYAQNQMFVLTMLVLVFCIFLCPEYGSLKPRKREGAMDMDTTLFMADKTRADPTVSPPAAEEEGGDTTLEEKSNGTEPGARVVGKVLSVRAAEELPVRGDDEVRGFGVTVAPSLI